MGMSIKKVFKFAVTTTLVLFICAAGFSIYTINNAPLEIFEDAVTRTEGKAQNTPITLERGSGTRVDLLRDYFLFSTGAGTFDQWYLELKKSVHKKNRNTIIFNKDISLPRPLLNECKRAYCFQKRLDFEKIPPIFWKGLIGIEDERFLLHKGIDPKSLARALIHDIMVMKLEQGGSTLTQQIVKNLFFTNEKRFSRKIKEMILAVYIESKFEKEKIIEAYLNEVIWGGKQGIKIKGLYAASLFYFSKKPDSIAPYEAAILISLLKGPNFYNPLGRDKRLRSRANLVYKKLALMNMFPPEEGELWTTKDWDKWIADLKNKQKDRPYRKNWWLSNNLDPSELGIYERYVLHSEITKIQKRITKKHKNKDIAVKVYIGDMKNLESNYFYYSKYERNWERAKSVERHTLGSTIKPLIYSLLVGLGSDMNDEVETGELAVKLKSGVWRPRESHKISEKFVTLKRALKLSYNRPIIRESLNRGMENVEKEMIKVFPDIKTPLEQYPAQLLGTVEVSLKRLFEIYRKFIIKDCKRSGESIVEMLSDPRETTIRKLVGKSFGELRFFGKTGTSNNGFDNWFIFYEGSRLGVIWVGLEGNRGGGDLKLYGGTTSFLIFKNFYLNSGKRFGEFMCKRSLLSH